MKVIGSEVAHQFKREGKVLRPAEHSINSDTAELSSKRICKGARDSIERPITEKDPHSCFLRIRLGKRDLRKLVVIGVGSRLGPKSRSHASEVDAPFGRIALRAEHRAKVDAIGQIESQLEIRLMNIAASGIGARFKSCHQLPSWETQAQRFQRPAYRCRVVRKVRHHRV